MLDALLDVRKPYEDRVTFIHVDIYENNKTTKLAPTVEAWRLPSEPWLYTVDGSGTIVGRIDGAFGRDEIVTQLDALVGTAG